MNVIFGSGAEAIRNGKAWIYTETHHIVHKMYLDFHSEYDNM